MYGEVQGTNVVPVVAGASTVAVLPATGVDSVVAIALAVAASLVVWGVTYYYRVVRQSR